MKNCPIIRGDIDDKECAFVCGEAIKEGKNNKTDITKKFKRIMSWKAICRSCKHHKS